ncbi:hypothetical protein ASG61_29245 [Bacillus sp. Leaf75]|nr:hypothetical protein ASG61_29245 [Bacillus sp. Leaf75]
MLRDLRKNYLWGNSSFFPLSIHIFLITKPTTQDAVRHLPLFLFGLSRSKKKKLPTACGVFLTYIPYKSVVAIMDLIGITRTAQRLLKEVFTTFFTINVMF